MKKFLLVIVLACLGCKTSNNAPLQSRQHLSPIQEEHARCAEIDPECIAFCECCHQCHWAPCKNHHAPPCHLDRELLEEIEVRIEEAQVTREPTSVAELYRTHRLLIMKNRKDELKECQMAAIDDN